MVWRVYSTRQRKQKLLLPLHPAFAAILREAGVAEAHVEEGREHEGEQCHRGSSHQVQNGSEAVRGVHLCLSQILTKMQYVL